MGVRVPENVGVAPYAPGPYTRGFSLLPCLTRGGSTYICGGSAGSAPIYAGIMPIHAGMTPLYAEKSPENLRKKFAQKESSSVFIGKWTK